MRFTALLPPFGSATPLDTLKFVVTVVPCGGTCDSSVRATTVTCADAPTASDGAVQLKMTAAFTAGGVHVNGACALTDWNRSVPLL